MITVADRTFDGPYLRVGSLDDRPGVYLILHGDDDGYHLIDLGEAEAVRTRLATHERRVAWARHCGAFPFYAVLYMPWSTSADRRVVEAQIRSQSEVSFEVGAESSPRYGDHPSS